LDGRIIKVDSEKGVIKPGQIKCLRNEGMPIKTGNINGDLFIEFEILFPDDDISKEEKEELSKILENNKIKILNKHVSETSDNVSKTTNLADVSEFELEKLKSQEKSEEKKREKKQRQFNEDQQGPSCTTQ